jgi:hypothetical protein
MKFKKINFPSFSFKEKKTTFSNAFKKGYTIVGEVTNIRRLDPNTRTAHKAAR